MATIRDRYVLEVDTRGATAALGTLSTAVKGFVAVLAVDQLVQFGRAITDATAQFQNYTNQLRLITDSQEELNQTFATLTRAAQQNRASFAETIDLYTKLTLATENLGVSQDDVLEVTTKFQQALAISGADANTAAGAIRQFGQAMASGTVRGDEFVSIVEALGPALNIMARESGLTIGRLRELSQAGELTAETFFDMIQASEALTAAFNSTEPTIDQLETALGDAFDRALVSLGEVTGATEGYERALRRLTRTFDDFADTPGNLADMAPGDVFREARDGAIRFDDAIFELSERIRNENWFGWLPGVGMTDREIAAIEGMIAQLQILKIENEALARQIEEETRLEQERAEALRATLAPFQQYIDQAREYTNIDFRTEVEKANDRLTEAQTVVEQLALAQEAANGQIENFEELLQAAQNQVIAAQQAVDKLNESTNELGEQDAFTKFYEGVIEGANDAAQRVEFTQLAIQRLGEELEAGRISIDTYAFAMDSLRTSFEDSGNEADELQNKLDRLRQSTEDSIASIDARIQQSREAAELSGLQGLERELRAIELEEERLAEAARERIRAQSEGLDASEIEAQLERINQATRDAVIARQEAARTIDANRERFRLAEEERRRLEEEAEERARNAQRTFAEGWKDAFDEYQKNATDAGQAAERLFRKTTKGMEDAIVNFAKTGKFEFKDLVSTILEELLRSQIQRLIAQTFGVFGGGAGGASGLFAGFFANGGRIPAGQFGVVGEAGPELVTGPANVIPANQLGGTGTMQVVYNIQAVDAPSFQALVARDPGFIHAVAQQGARKVPVRR